MAQYKVIHFINGHKVGGMETASYDDVHALVWGDWAPEEAPEDSMDRAFEFLTDLSTHGTAALVDIVPPVISDGISETESILVAYRLPA